VRELRLEPTGAAVTIRGAMWLARVIGVLEPGGAQLGVLRLCRALRPHGIATRLIVGDATPGGLDLARAHGFHVECFSDARGLQWEPCEAFADWLVSRLDQAHLIHAHMFGAWWAAARAAPPATPLVASEHNALAWPRESHDIDAARAARRLSRFFAHGPATRAWAARIGIEPGRIEAGESPVVGMRAAPEGVLPRPRITFAGRLAAEKGADVLLDALARLADPPPTFIIGDGEQRPMLEQRAADLGLADVVRFSGWQARPERFIAGASLHVVPSRADAWSQSAALAMGLGVPVIGAAVEGMPDMLAAGRGTLVRPEDPPSLARAIAFTLAGRMATDLAGARRWAQRFTPERIAARYAATYRALTEGQLPAAA
jgi:glycosyltransferase involved in cell wall biosynthesis